MADDASRGLTPATWVTLSRIVMAIVLGPAIIIWGGIPAALLIVLAGLSDFADGWLARKRNEVSSLGAALDPVADKLITVAALVGFMANGAVTGIHIGAVLIILLRETLIAGLREAAAGTQVLAVSTLAKWKTATQFLAFLLLCFGPSGPALGFLWASAILTAWTGAGYIIRWWASVK